jgi:hypothetical protein
LLFIFLQFNRSESEELRLTKAEIAIMKQVAIKEFCAPFLNIKTFRPQREQQFAEELSRIKEELLETKQVCTAVFQLQMECVVI